MPTTSAPSSHPPRTVAMPGDGAPPPGSASARRGGARDEDAPLKGLSVLAVDDEEDVRDLVRAILEGAGATVISASSASEALAVAKAATIQVIVSDIGMPEKDGYELMAEIRALPHHALTSTPAVALTAYATDADRARALAAGFQVHLTKPCSPALLVATVRELAVSFGLVGGIA